MRKETKALLDKRLDKLAEEDPNYLILCWPLVERVLKMFLYHPDKPGYIRKDIEYFLNPEDGKRKRKKI